MLLNDSMPTKNPAIASTDLEQMIVCSWDKVSQLSAGQPRMALNPATSSTVIMHWNHDTNRDMSSVCRAPTRYLLAKTIDIDVVQYAVTTDAILNTSIAIVLRDLNLPLSLSKLWTTNTLIIKKVKS